MLIRYALQDMLKRSFLTMAINRIRKLQLLNQDRLLNKYSIKIIEEKLYNNCNYLSGKELTILRGIIWDTPSWITALSWRRGLHNSMKLWAMPYRATQEGCVIVESSKMWSTGGGNGQPLQYSCLKNPMNMNSVLWPWASFTPCQTLKNYLVLNTYDWLKSNVMVEMKVICKWQIPVECEILLYKLSWCLKITLLS